MWVGEEKKAINEAGDAIALVHDRHRILNPAIFQTKAAK
jgi:hypothetical protein